jgi:hypothetical protein
MYSLILLTFSGMIPLCCFKSQKAQAVICISAGIGGLVTALVWFWQYSEYNFYASTGGYQDVVSTIATIFLLLGSLTF